MLLAALAGGFLPSEAHMPFDHESINEYDYMYLRQLLGLHDEDARVPDKIVEHYWALKRLHDRIGAKMDGSAMALMCYQLGHGKPNERESADPSVVELWHSKQLKYDDPVFVMWRKQEVPAVIHGLGADGVMVQIEGQDVDRELRVDKVRVAELATA
jgi:hypothetical protein